MEHGLPCCEVHVDIRSHPVFPDGSPWSTWVIRNDMDDAMENTAHVVLTALCSQCLRDTTGTPISLYLVQDCSDLEWMAHIDEECNVFQDHYHGSTYSRTPNTSLLDNYHRLGTYAREAKSLK
jgi:hypothetical protein